MNTPARLGPSFFFLLLTIVTAAGAGGLELDEATRVAPAWSLEFDSPVQWQRVTPLGQLVVCTAGELAGVDPATGKPTWRHADLGALAEERYEPIPGSPFVVIADEQDDDARVVVLDPGDGRIVFDSEAAGIVRLLDQRILHRDGSLLVFGFREGKPRTTMFLFDIASGELRWTNDELHGTSSKKLAAFASLLQAVTGDSGVRSEPFELADGSFLLASGSGVHKVSTATGEFVWTIKDVYIGDTTRFFVTARRPEAIFVGAEIADETSVRAVYGAYRLLDGEKLWGEPVKLNGGLNDVIFVDGGLIVSPRTASKGKIKLLDYDTGASKWGPKGKGLKLQGGIVSHDFSDAGIVLTTGFDNAWTNAGTQYYLDVLDPEAGVLKFKKPTKLEGSILYTETIKNGVLFVTTHEINIFDPATGGLVHPRSIVSDSPLVTATAGTKLYAFSDRDGTLYVVDRADGSLKKLSGPRVALEGKGETPTELELTGDGLILLSNQNIVAFDPDGKVRFQAYYPAPKYPALLRALLAAEAVRSGMAAAASTMTGAAFADAASGQEHGSLERSVNEGLAQGYAGMADGYVGLSGQYAEAARARFHASANSRDFMFMMIKLQKGYGLAKVSKTSGNIVGVIDMRKDKEPSYEVDSIAGQIYYRVGPAQLVSYELAEPMD